MNYTLNQLKIFLAITEHESVTKASEELHLTQPAVSIQLKNFQLQFDIPLTETIGRKIHITDFGYEIAEAAKNILEQVARINYKTMAFQGQLIGKLKISVVSTGKYVMPHFLADFIMENPGVNLIIDVTNKGKVIKSLENNEVDFSLVSVLPTGLNLESISLLKNKLFLVGKEIVDNQNRKDKELFENLPLIYRERGSGTRHAMESYIKQNNITALKKLELTSNEAVKQAILAGMGYSIMPLIGLKNELLNKELQIIPIENLPIETTWQMIWLKGKKHAPVAEAYLKYINEMKNEIVERKFNWYENFQVN
ncbi:MAG: DNA-binding transcriptional LysR family regulator [Arcticibacterium sp.]|jgi:DNA-binding transcriptional LysR family regulator